MSSNDLARAIELIHAVQDRSAVRRERTPSGTQLWNPRLPAVWDLNLLRVERAQPSIDAVALAAEAGRAQRAVGLAHRHVMVDERSLGDRLAPGFRALGWSVVRRVVMIHADRGEDGREATRVAPADVVELSGAALRPLRQQTFQRELAPLGEAVLRQLLAYDELIDQAVAVRHFAGCVHGKPVSTCKLIELGGAGQIEDVITLAEHRGRGLATAVVARALAAARAAGDDPTFIVADEDDWPKLIYQRLGFTPVGRIHLFRRLSSSVG